MCFVNSRAAAGMSNPGRRRPRRKPFGPISAMVGEWLMRGLSLGPSWRKSKPSELARRCNCCSEPVRPIKPSPKNATYAASCAGESRWGSTETRITPTSSSASMLRSSASCDSVVGHKSGQCINPRTSSCQCPRIVWAVTIPSAEVSVKGATGREVASHSRAAFWAAGGLDSLAS